MGKINVLSSDVAALIAAGEVVERPSSVIKELVENSIDSGATTIVVEIKNGGISYIRVTDNGSGIAPDDIKNAFLRHATSKISTSDDLERIITLGFRGEALNSIAAVSKIEVMTAQKGNEGVFTRIIAGETDETSPTGCPEGTTVIVRELFFNTPARMKFLKKDSTEAGYIEDIVRKIALGRPDISFKYINSGKEIFFTAGDNSLKNAVYAIYGRDIAAYMIEAQYEGDGVKVFGLTGKSELSRGNRSLQTFFVNGRCVINKSFYFALTESYKNKLMTGRFPVAVLNIEIDPSLCDVNVHPSKAEIKFAYDKPVYDAIYWAVKNALYRITDKREFEMEKATVQNEKSKLVNSESINHTHFDVNTVKTIFGDNILKGGAISESVVDYNIAPKIQQNPESDQIKISMLMIVDKKEDIKAEQVEQTVFVKVIGQIFKTYIVADVNNDMVLIDQHAAHERIIYDEIKNKIAANNPSSQVLLVAGTLQISPSEFALALENKEFFEKIGFEIEEFGNNTLRITMVPTTLGSEDAASAVGEMLEVLADSKITKQTAKRDKAIYTLACRAALKAGQSLTGTEQEELVRRALKMEGEPTCPHGRPIILKISKHQIEKQFKRVL